MHLLEAADAEVGRGHVHLLTGLVAQDGIDDVGQVVGDVVDDVGDFHADHQLAALFAVERDQNRLLFLRQSDVDSIAAPNALACCDRGSDAGQRLIYRNDLQVRTLAVRFNYLFGETGIGSTARKCRSKFYQRDGGDEHGDTFSHQPL